MNDRLTQLYHQARDVKRVETGDATKIYYVDYDAEQFAELIVRECVGVVEGGSFLHDQAPTAIFARECSGAIKRHFGVEE